MYTDTYTIANAIGGKGMIGIRCLHIRKIERKEDKYTGEQVLLGMIVRSGNLHGYTRG